MSECAGKEPEPEKEVDETKPDAEPVEKESSSNKGIIAVVLLLAVGGGGGFGGGGSIGGGGYGGISYNDPGRKSSGKPE